MPPARAGSRDEPLLHSAGESGSWRCRQRGCARALRPYPWIGPVAPPRCGAWPAFAPAGARRPCEGEPGHSHCTAQRFWRASGPSRTTQRRAEDGRSGGGAAAERLAHCYWWSVTARRHDAGGSLGGPVAGMPPRPRLFPRRRLPARAAAWLRRGARDPRLKSALQARITHTWLALRHRLSDGDSGGT